MKLIISLSGNPERKVRSPEYYKDKIQRLKREIMYAQDDLKLAEKKAVDRKSKK